MKKVAIITLTYNKFDVATKEFLESLYKFTNPELFDLIIVDNASTDGTIEHLKAFSSKKNNISLILNNENLGYSKGNNIGIKKALEGDYEYIALLNNDILLTPNWLEDTIDGFNLNEQLGMLSPRNNEKCRLTPKNYLKGYKNYLSKFKEPLRYVVTPFFSCVVIKRGVIDKIGLLDENFTPAFWEDNDYSFRAMYEGYSLAYINSVFIFHNHSTTSKSISSEIFTRNREYFFNKHPLGKWVWEHKRTNLLKDIVRYINEGRE